MQCREEGRFVVASQRLTTAPVSQACSVPQRNKEKKRECLSFSLEITLTSFHMSRMNLNSFKSAQVLKYSGQMFSSQAGLSISFQIYKSYPEITKAKMKTCLK